MSRPLTGSLSQKAYRKSFRKVDEDYKRSRAADEQYYMYTSRRLRSNRPEDEAKYYNGPSVDNTYDDMHDLRQRFDQHVLKKPTAGRPGTSRPHRQPREELYSDEEYSGEEYSGEQYLDAVAPSVASSDYGNCSMEPSESISCAGGRKEKLQTSAQGGREAELFKQGLQALGGRSEPPVPAPAPFRESRGRSNKRPDEQRPPSRQRRASVDIGRGGPYYQPGAAYPPPPPPPPPPHLRRSSFHEPPPVSYRHMYMGPIPGPPPELLYRYGQPQFMPGPLPQRRPSHHHGQPGFVSGPPPQKQPSHRHGQHGFVPDSPRQRRPSYDYVAPDPRPMPHFPNVPPACPDAPPAYHTYGPPKSRHQT